MLGGNERKEMYMDKDKAKQYHGYLALPRHSKILRQDIGYGLFSLYIALAIEARWFRGNPYFCCVVGTQTEIAARLGISQSTLSRGLDKLAAKDKWYAIKHTRYIRLGYFPLFLKDVAEKMAEKDYSTLHEVYADMYEVNAELQGNYATLQEKRGKNTTQRLNSSFKDDYSSFDSDAQGDAEGERE